MTTLDDILAELTDPFAREEIQVRPTAVNQDGTSALAVPYADWRCYLQRLDEAVGPENWTIELVPWGPTRIIARLTILGVTKTATGEGDPNDENCGTTAEAQAKKRACAEFGLGRFLYTLPKMWGKGSGSRNSFRFADGEEHRVVYEMYRRAGLLESSHEPILQISPEPEPPVRAGTGKNGSNGNGNGSNGSNGNGSNGDKLARARALLQEAEARAGMTGSQNGASRAPAAAAPRQQPGDLATDRQLGMIAMLLAPRPDGPERDRVGQQVGLDLTDINGTDGVRTLGLTKKQASRLIDVLKADELVVS